MRVIARILGGIFVLAFLAGLFFAWDVWYWMNHDPVPPSPPTATEIAMIESRFAEIRPELEKVVKFVANEGWDRLRAARDSAATKLDSTALAEAQRSISQFNGRLEAWVGGSSDLRDVHVDVQRESLIYFRVFARRGKGPSAGWAYAGYVHARRWPDRATKQLDEGWYLYTEMMVPG